MQAAPSFSISNFSLAPYTPRGNGRAYVKANNNYQASYSSVAYTDPIPLLNSSAGFLPNHTYHNVTRYNAYGQPEAGGFGYETPLQFPFRPQRIDMTTAQATVEPDTDSNNLTNQMATILCESFNTLPLIPKLAPSNCSRWPGRQPWQAPLEQRFQPWRPITVASLDKGDDCRRSGLGGE
jgi:hypothetical protein